MSFLPSSLHRAVKFALLPASLSLAILTGCGAGSSAPEGNSFVPAVAISGRAMGGQQPLSGATVNLYSVGTSGYGSGSIAANLLATTTTGIGGGFSFSQVTSQTGASSTVNATYGCPANSTLIYLTVAGGDPTPISSTTASNSAIKLIDALGACSSIKSSFLVVNEVSTVVTVAALQQYISPINEFIGSPSTTSTTSNKSAATTGIANAFATVQSVLYQPSGLVNTTYNPSSTVGTITAMPEVGKINTIADILAACVNTSSSSSGACNALFSAATATPVAMAASTNFATSYNPFLSTTDTLQAALFMLQNPTDLGTQVTSCNGSTTTTNIGCLFSLITGTPPFTALAAAPTDWTVSVSFASNSTTTPTGQASTVPVLGYAENLAIDKLGNVWVANNVTSSSTTNNIGASITELNPTGGTVQQVLTGGQVYGPGGLAFDPSGNLWIPNFGTKTASSPYGYGKTVVEFPAGSANTATGTSVTVGGCPFGVASDGAGNIYVGECTAAVTNTSTGNGTPGADVRAIPTGTTTSAALASIPTAYSADAFSAIAIDSKFNIFLTSDAAAGLFGFVPTATTTGSTTTYAYNSNITSTTASVPASLAIDNSNNVWVGNYATGGPLYELAFSGTAFTTSFTSAASAGGISKVGLGAIDGAGNTWTTDQASSAGAITEMTNAGVAVSPGNGFLHQYYYPNGIAIDPSGNVWIGTEAAVSRTAAAASGSLSGTAAGGYVTEILGAAVPVVTPIAAGLPTTAGGTSLLATTPQ